MHTVNRSCSLAFLFGGLAACSGSSSGGGGTTSATLAVTDAASDELSAFVIGLESVELQGTAGAVSLLPDAVGVDFAALGDLSRVLNVTEFPAGTYTGVEVVLDFDDPNVVILGMTTRATLLDSDGNPLGGQLTLPIDFPAPLVVTTGNYVFELDLDLDQSLDVDAGANAVYVEPTVFPRVNPAQPKERAIGGDLRAVDLAGSSFTLDLDAAPGDPIPVVSVATDSTTVFQVDGVCLDGAAGLSTLDNLSAGSWVQAFGEVDASSATFEASTVEAGTGSYNGGSDIVEGLIVARSGGAGQDAVLTVRGHSNNSTHTIFAYNLLFSVSTTFAGTKVVRRGSNQIFDTDELNVGQRVRMFGVLDLGNQTLDCTTSTDVIRLEPTRVYGFAAGAPSAGSLTIDLTRVDLRDENEFTWSDGGATPLDPNAMVLADPLNLASGQGIGAGTPVEAQGFFSSVDDAGADFVASTITNLELVPSLLVLRDRMGGMTVTPSFSDTQIGFTFGGVPAGREVAVVDQSFVGLVDVSGTGMTIEPGNFLGLGLYTIRDRTLNTVSFYLTFAAFSQALDATLLGGATLFNLGALGIYDSGTTTIDSALAGVVVQ